MKGLTAKLRSEVERLERDVVLRKQRLEKLKEALSQFESLTMSNFLNHIGPQPEHHESRMSKAAAVKDEVINLLKERPMHRKELLERLVNKNLMKGTSEEDMNYLASRLSMWSETATEGKGIWHLNRQH